MIFLAKLAIRDFYKFPKIIMSIPLKPQFQVI